MDTVDSLDPRGVEAIRDLIEANIVSGNIDDDTAVVSTAGLIGDITDLSARLAEVEREAEDGRIAQHNAPILADKLLAAEAKAKRLEEALQRINRLTSPDNRTFDECIRDMSYACDCARAALSPQPASTEAETAGEDWVCQICDGGPGNSCACTCPDGPSLASPSRAGTVSEAMVRVAKKVIALRMQFEDFGHADEEGDWRMTGAQVEAFDRACEEAACAVLAALSGAPHVAGMEGWRLLTTADTIQSDDEFISALLNEIDRLRAALETRDAE